ncbi:MAG: hypothetical protein WCB97_00620 [Thiobacillus sp.]
MKSFAVAIIVAISAVMPNIGKCESIFEITPSNFLGDLRPKFQKIELMRDFGDATFPVFMVESPGIKGFLLISFFDIRATYPSMKCIQKIPTERALRVARVQFVPNNPPQTQTLLAKYGKNHSEKLDDNLQKKLIWKDKGIEAILDPSGQYVKSVINDFTAEEQEKAAEVSVARIAVTAMGCSE